MVRIAIPAAAKDSSQAGEGQNDGQDNEFFTLLGHSPQRKLYA